MGALQPPNNFGDGGGEYWALDNVVVTTSAAPAPALAMRRTTTNSVVISWPSPSTGFTLQENPDLTTTNWAVVQGLTDDGTNRSVIANPPVGNGFYRLHKTE